MALGLGDAHAVPQGPERAPGGRRRPCRIDWKYLLALDLADPGFDFFVLCKFRQQARYRGLTKTGLQSIATAAALNLDRLAAWFAGRPLAPTRTSRFAALQA